MIVMVVDDEYRSHLVDRFESRGATVIEAINGKEALKKILAGPVPDVLLTDLKMPVMDGNGLVESIAARPEFDTMRIAIITGSSTREISDKAAKRANAIFRKGGDLAWITDFVYEQ